MIIPGPAKDDSDKNWVDNSKQSIWSFRHYADRIEDKMPDAVIAVRVGLYCKAFRAYLRHARTALATAPQCRPKGSLSLTRMWTIYAIKS